MKDYRNSHTSPGYGKKYDIAFAEKRTGFYWQFYEKPFLEKTFAKLSKQRPGPLLDFACGTGRICSVASQYFSDITGLDISEEMLEQARSNLPGIRFIKADATRDMIELNRFTIITAFRFILNAQPELRSEALTWIYRQLIDDGLLIINNHLRVESIKGAITKFLNKAGLSRKNALSDYEFEELLKNHGFKAEKVFSFTLVPGWHGFPPINPEKQKRLEKFFSRLPFICNLHEQCIYICRKAKS
ncbi:MAG: hypothetical protein Kow0029_04610 [Candidatus Rifleibacteriota bacterium]